MIGVVGAGTMGAGIAQLSAAAGEDTVLIDADPDAVARAIESIGLGVRPGAGVGDLAGCDVVIEAVPERLELKQELFAEVAGVAGAGCVLATNTSSIPVTQIAGAVPHPERVVGMHFFNPAQRMRLVEVIAGLESADWALDRVTALGEAMGKRVIRAADGPGFLVNRVSRPFGLEALRLLQERVADVETIDRVVRLGGGFRMGPFELQDLVGIDVGFAVSRSFYEGSFGEPRWRPSPLQARMAASGRLGRKTGRGWYAYADGQRHRPRDPEPPDVAAGDGLIVVAGSSVVAFELIEAAAEAGWDVATPDELRGDVPYLALDCGHEEGEPPLEGGPHALLCDRSSLVGLEGDGPAAGFHVLPPLGESRLVELTRVPGTSPAAAERTEHFFASIGKHVAWVGDAPGLVLGRIVCQLVNEAAFALGEGIGSAEDIDAGMVLGLNHPRGPLAWADAMGLDHVAAVLAALQAETGEERYRLAPELRRRLQLDLTFHGGEPL